jgi:MraZ protein
MGQFLGTHANRLDSKGRVSVPAAFRTTLARLDTTELVLRPSHKWPCIEAWPEPAFREFAGRLDQFDAFSDEHDDLAIALFADAQAASPDAEGRIVLNERLAEYAGLEAGKPVAFVGFGKIFLIWEPGLAQQHLPQSVARARERGLTVPRGARP